MKLNEIANQIWNTLTNSEKKMVRFGIFPAAKMDLTKGLNRNDNHTVVCELMNLAKTS